METKYEKIIMESDYEKIIDEADKIIKQYKIELEKRKKGRPIKIDKKIKEKKERKKYNDLVKIKYQVIDLKTNQNLGKFKTYKEISEKLNINLNELKNNKYGNSKRLSEYIRVEKI
jgi:hypothetical protein